MQWHPITACGILTFFQVQKTNIVSFMPYDKYLLTFHSEQYVQFHAPTFFNLIKFIVENQLYIKILEIHFHIIKHSLTSYLFPNLFNKIQ